jgi:hypothetical protein
MGNHKGLMEYLAPFTDFDDESEEGHEDQRAEDEGMRGEELKGRGGNHPRQIQKMEAKDRRAGTKLQNKMTEAETNRTAGPFYAY